MLCSIHMETNKKQLINRLNRAEGQIRALRQHLEDDTLTDCREFITQVKAARAALKRASELYILEHIHQCDNLPKEKRGEKVTEAINLLASD